MWVYVLYTHMCARTCMHIISVRICARICTPVYAYVRMAACMRVDRTSHGLVSRDSDSLADREHGRSVPSERFPSPEPESPQLPADLNLKQTQCLSSDRNTSGNSMKLFEAKSREISSRFTRKIVAYRNSFPDTIVTARNTLIFDAFWHKRKIRNALFIWIYLFRSVNKLKDLYSIANVQVQILVQVIE